ncbi:MAG: MFS transporter [Lachnospiraceae bacterium]|nr:MFS transporter [Lachnospiraceae bacterium]
MKNVEKKDLTVSYSFIMGAYWMIFAGVLGFSSVYLLDCGLNSSKIGIMFSAASILAALLQPLVAGYADRPDSLSLKTLFLGLSALALIFAGFLPLVKKDAWLSLIVYGAGIMLLQLLLPFSNALGTEMMNQGVGLNWGVARGIGSVSYAFASFAIGRCLARFGTISVPMGIIICYMLLIGAVLFYPFQKRSGGENQPAGKKGRDGTLAFFRRYPRFFYVWLGTICLFVGHNFLNVYVYQIILSKGGDNGDVGNALAICALCELPVLFLWRRMIRKVECGSWLKICSIVMTLKVLGTLLAPSMGVFTAVQFTQALGFALIAIAPVYYTLYVVGREDAIRGQAYMSMTTTLGNIIASVSGGKLIDALGVSAMLIAALVSSFLGVILYFVFIANRDSRAGDSCPD